MKKAKKEYKRAHEIAKTILFVMQVILTCLITFVFFTNNLIYLLPIFLIKECLYYFGVNTVAYIVETALNYKHRHDII